MSILRKPRVHRRLLALLGATLALVFTLGLGSPPALAEYPAAIKGQVLSEMDPIDYARVTVFNADTGTAIRSVVTDESGHYLVTGIPAGRIQVRARKAGYLDAWASGVSSRAEAAVYTLSPGQMLEQTWDEGRVLYLDLTPEAVISGSIMGFSNSPISGYDDPVAGVTITAFSATTGAKLGSAISQGLGVGEQWGSFRIGMLPAGPVVLRATKSGWLTTWAHDKWTKATAEVFTVQPHLPVDVGTFAIYAPASIQGGVMLDDEPVAKDVTVSVFDADSGRLIKSIIDDDGYFLVDNLPPVRVKVRASGPFYTTGWATWQTTWEKATTFTLVPGLVTGELQGVINVSRAATIKGQVLGDSHPIGNAQVTVFDAQTGLALRSSTTDGNGFYSVTKIPVGFAGKDVKVRASKAGWVPSWANGMTTKATADSFHLSGGQTLEQSSDPQVLYLNLQPIQPVS